jgi:hypothetical protein
LSSEFRVASGELSVTCCRLGGAWPAASAIPEFAGIHDIIPGPPGRVHRSTLLLIWNLAIRGRGTSGRARYSGGHH